VLPMRGPQVPPSLPPEQRAPLFSDLFSVLVDPRGKVRSLHLLNMPGGLSGPGKKKDAASSTENVVSAPVLPPNQDGKDVPPPLVWNFMTLMPSITPSQLAAAEGSAPPTVEPPVSPGVSGPTPSVPLLLQTISAIRPEIRFAPDVKLAATDSVPENPDTSPAVPANARTYADGKNPLPLPEPVMTPPADFSTVADPTALVPPVPVPAAPSRERPDIAALNPAAGWEDSRQSNLAFAARLVPLPPQDVAPLSGLPGTEPAAKPESDAPPSPVPGQPHAEISTRPVSKNEEPERVRKTADLAPAAVLKTTNPELQPVDIPQDRSQPAEKTAAPETGQPPVRAESQPLPEPAPAAGAARDIQFQVNQGGQRVDVRLTERSGEVHVSVRTPDAQLAGTLREDLPALSAKLEQSGFRAETWRPGMSTPPPHFGADETGFSNTPHDGQHPPPRQGGQEQQQAPPRRPKPSLAESATSQRKEFSWHISQLP
jgi:hypothetical protein